MKSVPAQSATVGVATRTLVPRGPRLIVVYQGRPPEERSLSERGSLEIGRDDSLREPGLYINHPDVSRRHALLEWDECGIRVRDLGSKNGVHVGSYRIEREFTIHIGDDIRLCDDVEIQVRGSGSGVDGLSDLGWSEEISPDDLAHLPSPLTVRDARLKVILGRLRRYATEPLFICLGGETGVGKNTIAKAIHYWSGRTGEFCETSCANIDVLFESEIFGHTKGAFTGAVGPRTGLAVQAHNGTLFLDEWDSLSKDGQSRLLGILANKKVRPLGSQHEVPCNFRLIAATHRSPRELVDNKIMRQDLAYRVAEVYEEIPPLRERPSDIPALVEVLSREIGKESKNLARRELRFTVQSMNLLRTRPWMGNIRELRSFVGRLYATVDGDTVEPKHILRELNRDPLSDSNLRIDNDTHNSLEAQLERAVREQGYEGAEKTFLRFICGKALEATRGHIGEAAELLKLERSRFARLRKQEEKE